MAISSPMPSTSAIDSPYYAEFDAAVRKRTSSFSVAPPPAKAPRKSSLQRTASFLVLPDLVADAQYLSSAQPTRRRSHSHRVDPYESSMPSSSMLSPSSSSRVACSILRKPVPAYPPPPAPLPSCPLPRPIPQRSSSLPIFPPSPAGPFIRGIPTLSNPCPKSFSRPRNPKSARRFLPPRERYPKCKDEPSLYRTALLGRLGNTPAGEQILRMGARMAVAMLEATRAATQALENMVAEAEMEMGLDLDMDFDMDAEGEPDEDVEEPVTPTEEKTLGSFFEPMVASPSSTPPHLTDSWLVIPQEDWEMVTR